MDVYSSARYYPSCQGDNPAKNLRSRAGMMDKPSSFTSYELPPTPGTPFSMPMIPMTRSTRSQTKRHFTSSYLQEELDIGKNNYAAGPSSGYHHQQVLHTPQHFMSDDSPNKFLDMDSPEKHKVAFTLQETTPLSFDCVLDPIVPLSDYNFSGLMEQMQMEEELSTPQPSPGTLSPPYSNETQNPFTPFTDSDPPATPNPDLSPSTMEYDEDDEGMGHHHHHGDKRKAEGSHHHHDGSRKSKRLRTHKIKDSPQSEKEIDDENEIDEDSPEEDGKKHKRKSPIKDIRMFPRVELLPPSPQDSEWFKMRDGCIKELRLVNFMCHTNKHWKFGPHLNIITGENGSGKTAVQTAIMIVCGAKASTTGRADSMQMVIQRGETYAMIELVLSNHNGTHSKRKFGEEIRLRKTINKSSSITKVLLRDGKWHAMKKHALDSLLRPLQIHLNNPVQILTQKMATNFLAIQEPPALFKSFKDITQISSAEECLKTSRINIASSKATVTIKTLDYKQYKQKEQEAETQLKKILEIEKFKLLCAKLRREKAWSAVKQIESAAKELELQVGEVDQQIKATQDEKAKLEKTKGDIVASHEKEKSILHDLKKEASVLEAQHEKAHEAFRETYKENQNSSKRIKLLNDSKAKLHQDLAEVERQKRDSMSVKANNDERIKNQTEFEMRNYDATIEEASHQLTTLRAAKLEQEDEQRTFVSKAKEYEELFHQAQAKLRDKQRGLKNIEDAEASKYDKFGSKMKVLVKQIQKKKWLGHTPVGPLGACFTVKKEFESYAPVIEETLGRTLRTFVTDHADDVNNLRQLIQDIYGNSNEVKPSIIAIVGNHKEGEWWSKGKAVIPGYPTILDVLDIQHPKVTEALIENQSVEKVILFETEQQACSIFKDAKKVPRTCIYGVSKDCFKFNPVPNYKVQPLQLRRKSHYLQITKGNARESLESEIQSLKLEASEANEAWQNAKREMNGYSSKLTELTAHINQKVEEINRARTLHRRCEQVLEELANVPDPASQNDFLEEQKRQFELTLSQAEDDLAEQLAAKEASDLSLKEREKESKALKVQLDELRKRIQACDDGSGVFQKRCNELDKKIKGCDTMLKNIQLDKKKLQKEFEAKRKEADKAKQEALKKGDRIDTSRSPEEIQSELEGKENFFKANLHMVKVKDDVRRAAKKWKKAATDIYYQLLAVNKIIRLLEPLTNVQMQHLEVTKLSNLTHLQNYYRTFIQLRGYTGQVLFDITEQKLFYYVGVDKKSEVKAQAYIHRNNNRVEVDWKGLKEFTMQLSGGERSFSTMAFISALRQIMVAPFFMLDEFEVFMDGGNKRVSMEIIVKQVHSHTLFDAQFFVFTPHEPDELPQDDSFIKYFKLQHNGRMPISNPPTDKRTNNTNDFDDNDSSLSKRRRV